MLKLIEFKLWNGVFPYFVKNVVNGAVYANKYYGASIDTSGSYLPDTVKWYETREDFISAVMRAEIRTCEDTGDPEPSTRPMTDDEKRAYLNSWLDENYI